jgi:AAA domain
VSARGARGLLIRHRPFFFRAPPAGWTRTGDRGEPRHVANNHAHEVRAHARTCRQDNARVGPMGALPRVGRVQRSRLSAMALDPPARGREDNEAEVPLSGVRAEFRTALRAEIEAAKGAAATAAIPLLDGRKIGRLADAFQYVFGAEAAISAQSDSPGELSIEGRPPAEAVVIAVEGLDVALSVSQDLGERVPRAVLRIDLVFPLRRLIARIEETGRKPNPAGDRLLGAVSASGAPELIDDALLNEMQDAALGSSLGRDITFIWGPPGPARTRTVGSIGAHLYRRRRSLLVVSHTNGAVDQALVEIVERLGADLAVGALLRLGIPSDQRLREREDLLLDAVVGRRQQELRARQGELRTEKLARQTRIGECERLLGIAAWAAEGRAELADFLRRLDALHTAEGTRRRLAAEVARRARDEAELRALLAEGQDTARREREAERLPEVLRRLADELDAARAAVAVADVAASEAQRDYEKACELGPLVARERALPALGEQRRAVEALAVREAEAKQEVDAARERLREAEETHAAGGDASAIRRFRAFMLQLELRRVLAARRAQHADAQVRLGGVSARLRRARAVLAELEQLDRQLAPRRKLGSAAIQAAQLKRREAERDRAAATGAELERLRAKLERRLAEAAEAVARFRRLHAAAPRGVVARIEPQLAELRQLREKLRETEQRADDLRNELEGDLSVRLATIEALGLGRGSSRDNARERFEEVAWAQFEARRLAAEIDAAALEAEATDCRRELGAIDEALARIDQELEAIGRTAIAEARVIATTLTRVYLWNEIQDRRFDTVILDDASTAVIPALWIVARLADANVVVIGDLAQPPPNKQAQHPLADKWLGRNVFEVSRARLALDRGTLPPHVVQLNQPSGQDD